MTAEDRIQFNKEAGGYVLDKKNKLRILFDSTKEDKALYKQANLRGQVTLLKKHSVECDINDV